MRKIATVCLLLLVASASSADAVDTYLRTEMTSQRIPGVAVAVLRDGKPVSVRTVGVANILDFENGATDVAIELAKDARVSGLWIGRR
jgi:CubicO group peptidase (beta-lactamase class C family)